MEADKLKENYKTGYIWLFRSLKDRAFFKKPDYLALWILLLLKATRKELKLEVWFKGQSIFLKPGQFLTGRKKLSIESGINESKIERILNYFEKTEQQIEQQKSSQNRLISIINWSKYQAGEQQIEQQLNNDRTTSEQRVNTDNNEDKEDSVEKEDNIYNGTDISFDNFWKEYDKKVDLQDCRNKWSKMSKVKRKLALDYLSAYKKSRPDKFDRRDPVRYLGKEVWNNEIVVKNTAESIKETPKKMPWKYDKITRK